LLVWLGRVSPRRATYFSYVAKKSRQKKATLVSVTPAAPGQPAMLAPSGIRANSPCGLKHARIFIRLPLRFSAQTQGREIREPECRDDKGTPWRALVVLMQESQNTPTVEVDLVAAIIYGCVTLDTPQNL